MVGTLLLQYKIGWMISELPAFLRVNPQDSAEGAGAAALEDEAETASCTEGAGASGAKSAATEMIAKAWSLS
jgi:hypothetical protein